MINMFKYNLQIYCFCGVIITEIVKHINAFMNKSTINVNLKEI